MRHGLRITSAPPTTLILPAVHFKSGGALVWFDFAGEGGGAVA